ncbi:predicted protein [Nematostella vectensis]|uniref:Uncharacterized protein n=1 Tax=Nematostella vectensis TaxID=45351 RepID=A7SLS8_NEMVE|nr:predicted protein [Nematostella vectensis]|eukprot:XP_001627466.1 predicted protein [Nematostella vectensis]
MDLRISADSDIKRLREMVQKLEEKNAGLNLGENPASNRLEPETFDDEIMNVDLAKRVAVKLRLEDVPLLDLRESDSEEEDTWLYVSPVRPPTPADRKVSPYKYLKHSIDGTNLSKVRGSLMAKLESIASQEAPVRRRGTATASPSSRSITIMPDEEPVASRPRPRGRASGNFTVNIPDDEPVRSQPRPRSTPAQTSTPDDWEMNQVNEALVRRRQPQQSMPGPRGSPKQAWQGEEEECGPVRPRHRGPPPQRNSLDDDDDDDDDDEGYGANAPVVRRRAPPTSKPSDDSLVVTAVRRRQGSPQDSQIRPRGSGSPSLQYGGGLPSPARRGTPSKLRAEETEIRRRSLPQVPSSRNSLSPSSYSDHQITPRGPGTKGLAKPRVRSVSPGGRLGQKGELPVVPRGSRLAAPRRIPMPSSSYTEAEQGWQDGCY